MSITVRTGEPCSTAVVSCRSPLIAQKKIRNMTVGRHGEGLAAGSTDGSLLSSVLLCRETNAISAGSTIRMRKGVSVMPPTTTTASGFCTYEPIPVDKAAGSKPTPAITQVMSTGRI
jgi:hypothetical protein